jgi:hypothetical protein
MQSAGPIDREPVESSNLKSIGYSAARNTLAVEFRNGTIVHYSGVGMELATAFYCAESKGSFFAKQVRGKFPANYQTGPCSRCGAKGLIGQACEAGDGGVHARAELKREVPPDVEVSR